MGVFLIWSCPTSGFEQVTDTFLFDEILLDYTEASVIKVYNHTSGALDEYKGLARIRECFTGLFESLSDTSGLAAPAIRVEESGDAPAGSVFLVWRCPSSGFAHATDTFLFDADGKIAKQNVVVS